MVSSKSSKVGYFCLFLLPAFLLYVAFFIIPLLQGIRYSFTDWNGIVPEIPFSMEKQAFDSGVLAKLGHPLDRAVIRKFYRLDDSGENYLLQNWLTENGRSRQITQTEKRKIKAILKSIGISSIKFIGLDNYKEIFCGDERFMPRFQIQYLFNQFDELPTSIARKTFQKNLLNHMRQSSAKEFLLDHYRKNSAKSTYNLVKHISDSDLEKLRMILAENMYRKTLVWGVLGFTLFFTFFNVIFANVLALLLALALDQSLKARNLLRAIFFLPNVLSLVIVAFIWSFVFRLILPALTGITSWFEPDLAPFTVVIVSVWQSCGYLMIIYLAGLQAIPQEILEVAKVDGAPAWQRFCHVTLPLLLPAVTICLFYSLSNSLKTFEVALALTNGGPAYVTTPIVLDIYNNAFLQNRFGYGTAKAVFLCIVIMLITGVQLSLMKKREVEL
jgi:raffinose/stachyose/melibiose transport system permease protein